MKFRFDEKIATQPMTICAITFLVGLVLTAIAFVAVGISVSTEWCEIRGSEIARRHVQFMIFSEDGETFDF